MLPNFIVVGQAKCGTTSVCHHISKHPQVFFSRPKEPWFFGSIGKDYTPSEYEDLFKGAEGFPAVGEGSTSYTRPDIAREAAEDMHRYVPDCRLIYMVRDPMDRLMSDWKMRVREGRARPDDINHEIRTSEKLVTLGDYWSNIAPYRDLFSDDQILILFLRDVAGSPAECFERIWRHINVDPTWVENDVTSKNAAGGHRKDGFLLGFARQSGILPLLRRAVPEQARDQLKSMFTTTYHYAPNWDPGLRAEVEAKYREWSAPLLAHCGKPADFWSIGPRAETRPAVTHERWTRNDGSPAPPAGAAHGGRSRRSLEDSATPGRQSA